MPESSPKKFIVRFKKNGHFRNFVGQYSRVDRTHDQLNAFCTKMKVTSDVKEWLLHWTAALREPESKLALEPTDMATAEIFLNFMNSTSKPTDESYDLADFFEPVSDGSM